MKNIKDYLKNIPPVFGYSIAKSVTLVEKVIEDLYEKGEKELGDSYFKMFKERYELLDEKKADLEKALESFNKVIKIIKDTSNP